MAVSCGYIVVDVKTRKTIAIGSGIALLLFAIGIIIGYFSGSSANQIKDPSVAEAIRASCYNTTASANSTIKTFFDRYVERHSMKNTCVKNSNECWDLGLPRNYIAYHLNEKVISIDGKLNEDAWTEVPWSEKFVDMRSKVFPKPYYDSKFKLRWDDTKLYIGAYIQEKNLWATYVAHDSPVFREDGFEVLMEVDGSLYNYKQAQINVLGTMYDLLFEKSSRDAPMRDVANKTWHAHAQKAVSYVGTVNTPGDVDKYWSVEIALPFQYLAAQSKRTQPAPTDNEVWFTQFGRSEQKLQVNNGQYSIVPNSTTAWWSWQPVGTTSLHLQDRWGLVQFKRNAREKKFRFDKWHIYKSLFDMMYGLRKYKAVNGRYTANIEELDIPPYLMSGACVEVPEIELNGTDFTVTVKSKLISHLPAHINSMRYVTFK